MIRVVNLETAKLLKEAGFPQANLSNYSNESAYGSRVDHFSHPDAITSVAMPTADELLEELPAVVVTHVIEEEYDVCCWLQIDKNGEKEWMIRYEYSQGRLHQVYTENLCEALAQMWLHLKKEGLLGDKKCTNPEATAATPQ